eukprot:gene994-1252_t
MEAHHLDATTGEDEFASAADTDSTAAFVPPENRDPNDISTWGKVGRNEVCPCGSGKRYKHCHGALA